MGEPLDFTRLSAITFEQPDLETFRGLALAYEAGRAGGSMPTVLNAANEKAVSLFLQEKISYPAITEMIEEAMRAHTIVKNPSLDEILEVEQETCRFLEEKYVTITKI